MGVQGAKPFVEYDHSTVGVGEPDAAAVNEAGLPDATLSFVGSVVITGALVPPVTVRVAAFVVELPCQSVNTASYLYPFSEELAVNE
jgi:hypothetical protein